MVMETVDVPRHKGRALVEVGLAAIAVMLAGLLVPGLGLVLALTLAFTVLRTEKRSWFF